MSTSHNKAKRKRKLEASDARFKRLVQRETRKAWAILRKLYPKPKAR